MNRRLILILYSGILISCQNYKESSKDSDDLQDKGIASVKDTGHVKSSLAGQDLFNAILDTINIEPLNKEILTNSSWRFIPFDNCISGLAFYMDGRGESYNCELEETTEIKYRLDNDTLLIEEFDIPHVDNPDLKKIKIRDDKFALSNNSLVMIGSTMYNLAGKSWTPEIKTTIRYKKE